MPTPLGNLRDITLRALDVLRDCDLVVAEDTRVARKLLGALALPSKPLWSYREQNAAAATQPILERAATGRVALVADAGMPAISDPGRELLVAARAAGIAVEVLPGPSAFICAAVLSGFALERLCFRGFLPRRAGERETVLRAALGGDSTTVFYESPQRVVATLEALREVAPAAGVFVGRELTKTYEQQILGTPDDALAALERPVRGEIVLVLAAARQAVVPHSGSEIDAAIDAALGAGLATSEIAKRLAKRRLGERGELYRRTLERKRATGPEDV